MVAAAVLLSTAAFPVNACAKDRKISFAVEKKTGKKNINRKIKGGIHLCPPR